MSGHQEPTTYELTFNYDQPHTSVAHKTNYIRTTKYTIWSFLPVNLFGQFRRFYNLYFLLGAILSVVLAVFPDLGAVVNPATQIAPLVIVLAVTAVKDAIEDYTRYRSDKRANNIEFEIVNQGVSQVVKSKSLRPGDLIYIEKGQQFPADIIILSSSAEGGLAYIETAELDGETNLKRRQGLTDYFEYTTLEKIKQLVGKIECQLPSPALYEFEGRMTIGDKVHSLTKDQLLLRGSILRNTTYIYGIVCYVGQETKIMKNLKNSRLKFSSLEGRLNMLVVAIFVANAVLLLISSILAGVWQAQEGQKAWYIKEDTAGALMGAINSMAYYILYTYMIPISLFVTIEISRLVQALFMFWDDKMMSVDKKRMQPKNSNLNEDLGRVEHVFSDKTGTLTQNIMKLKNWYVNGRIFESNEEEFISIGKGESGSPDDQKSLQLFLKAVSVCHTVVPSKEEESDEIIYEGDSPDEAALLDALRDIKIIFQSRNPYGVDVDIFGKKEHFEILKVVEFTSSRKRMTVVVRMPTGEIEIFCKGADNVILERASTGNDRDMVEFLNTAISNFSKTGLRTLLVAHRTLSEEEYKEFAGLFHMAETALEKREDKIAEVAETIERDLVILGATAVEDKLQDDVAETIDYLINAGIHVWMLTGDKLETAISIGKSTKFISDDMEILIVDTNDETTTGERIREFISHIGRARGATMENGTHMKEISRRNHALVVTGKSVHYALKDFPQEFLQLSEMADSVVCCRMAPAQKADIVKLVRKNCGRICLSIGDGANDVSMIQVANVGVGIIGLEGTQAVRASDFAFKEFRCLRRLLTVHGRYSYLRMSTLIYYSFYKNLTFIFPQFWFGFVGAWSGNALYQELVMTFFNLIFTSLPPFFLALFEKDIEDNVINKYPQVYKLVQKDVYFNTRKVVEWSLFSLWHSLVLFFYLFWSYGNGIISDKGYDVGFSNFSAMMSFYVLTTVMIKWSMTLNHWQVFYFIAGFLSYAVFVGIMFGISSPLYSYFTDFDGDLYSIYEAMGTANFYFSLALAVVTSLLPDLLYSYSRRTFVPFDWEILQEEDILKKKKNGGSAEKAEESGVEILG